MKVGVFVKNVSVIQVFAVVLVLVGLVDFVSNGNLPFGNLLGEKEIVSLAEQLPELSKQFLPSSIKVGKSQRTNILFSKFDISTAILGGCIKTEFFEGNKKYLIIYELKGGLNTYLRVKNTVEEAIKSNEANLKDSKYEANNLGTYSFYFNSNQEKDMVFLVSLIKGTVFAFEYAGANHDKMKIFTKSLVDNL